MTKRNKNCVVNTASRQQALLESITMWAHLCEIFADGLSGSTEIMAEGTGIACLAGTLAEEFAGHM
jgi:hypothetical protein